MLYNETTHIQTAKGLHIFNYKSDRIKGGIIMFITPKEWLALSLRNRMLLLEAVANKNK